MTTTGDVKMNEEEAERIAKQETKKNEL